jgi:hypothetical protein
MLGLSSGACRAGSLELIQLDVFPAALGLIPDHELADLLQGEILELAHPLAGDFEFRA